jgi:predicted kinase
MSLYLLCGLAFSGKSTLAAAISRHAGAAVVSLDEINASRGLYGGVGIPDEEWGRTHAEALGLVDAALREGLPVVVDDTNCFRFLRDNYREIADRHGVPSVVIHVVVPLGLALSRRRANDLDPLRAPVTESVMLDLVEKFEWPAADETVLVFPGDADPEVWVSRNVQGALDKTRMP